MKPGTDCRDTGAKTGAKIQSADLAAERRRLARLSDQWADRAVKYGCRGDAGASWFAACIADRMAEAFAALTVHEDRVAAYDDAWRRSSACAAEARAV